MAGWSIKLVGPVRHCFTLVTCFPAGVNEFQNCCITVSTIRVAPSLQFDPRIPPSQSTVRIIFFYLEDMLINYILPKVAAFLRNYNVRLKMLRKHIMKRSISFLLRRFEAPGSSVFFNLILASTTIRWGDFVSTSDFGIRSRFPL